MKSIIVIIIILIVSVSVFASSSTISKSGRCSLQEAGPFDHNKMFVLDLKNSDVRVVFSLRGDEFFGRFVIPTTPKITNLSGQPKHIAYNLSFFDRSGNLIACTSSSADLESDEKDLQAGSNMQEIPCTSLEKISSYQAVIYVSDK